MHNVERCSCGSLKIDGICENCEKNGWTYLGEDIEVTGKDISDIFNISRRGPVLVGDFIVAYNGEKFDTYSGRTESWTVTRRNLSLFGDNEKENTILGSIYVMKDEENNE